ncbi:adenine deaminase [Echinicola vietnamensis]|uniref:Adenine deaminase n=1 Tax=Echinicola vietnamensis (strain DSM 17526 / LMG 23754 / KMM 6221) TaxID=926556 RepID=L0FY83_ECHVK|nr:adenine deaminase [Echinicola vietnamensis]AGA78262.1 adenine deaminase [Echinicola vietnamensis DSM 17526]
MSAFHIAGQLVNIPDQKISPVKMTIENGKITSVEPTESAPELYLMPGFIDAHVHVESSMLIPSEFARLAVVHGTVATVSDPHEIANVCGKKGVEYMIENGKRVNFNFYFGAPSCVPATPFETAGGEITAQDIDELLDRKEVRYLAEMMNWPGVINRDPAVMDKIALAAKHGKPVDGHAPGLKGLDAQNYISAGISTDHECFTEEEALAKLQHGMKIIVREGSAAKNFEALIDLIDDHAEHMMFCSDDKHPDNLVIGHINQLAARAVAKGKGLFKVLQAACLNPIAHYGMDVGQLRPGDPADFIICKDLKDFQVTATYIKGQKVAENGRSLLPSVASSPINNFSTSAKHPDDFKLPAPTSRAKVIEAFDGQLITRECIEDIQVLEGYAEANVAKDVLKFAVVNRYQDTVPSIAFIKNVGLKEGAIASSVGHDSHNILAVGVDNASITKAVNMIIKEKGGISAVSASKELILPLPIAGIMSAMDGYEVAKLYTQIDLLAKKMGSKLDAPYMTLSFMALLVIPALKLSDKGLFDGTSFQFTSPFHREN